MYLVDTSVISESMKPKPDGHRKTGYRKIVETIVSEYAHKTLGFNTAEALISGEYRRIAKATGYNPGVQDMMIAAIAKANGMILATRNTEAFAFLDLDTVNPFDEG